MMPWGVSEVGVRDLRSLPGLKLRDTNFRVFVLPKEISPVKIIISINLKKRYD
jgi:hypothetical protein